MTKTTTHTKEINILTLYVMEYFENQESEEDQLMIGGYLEHFISERFTYIVALNPNGRLEMSMDVVRDYETSKRISADDIKLIANSYRPQ